MSGSPALPDRPIARVVSALLSLLACALALISASCVEPAPGPPADHPRLAVLSPALSATLVELGLADRIVARHAWDMALESAVPSIGEEGALDAEALIRARPTHVLIEQTSRQSIELVENLAERTDWKILIFDIRTLDGIAASAHRLREEFAPGDEAAAAAIADFERAIAPRDAPFTGRVLLLANENPPGAIGPDSFHGEILDRFGVKNAIDEPTAWRRLDAEDVLRLAPDAIVMIHPRTPGAEAPPPPTIEDLRARLGAVGELDIPAVSDGRLALIDEPSALTPSLAMGRFARELADILASFGP